MEKPTNVPPPFRLPGIHFVGAVLWLVVGGAGLVLIAPDLAVAHFLDPRVLAVTHVYTLGVIVASVFGALYQFYPMSLGAGARSVRVGVWGGGLLHAGIATIVAGFWFWLPALQAAGWVLLFLAVGCVSWNLLPHRRRMTQGRRAAGYVSTAHSMLGLAIFIAGARIGASLGWWSFDRLGAIAAHFHLAAFGFAGLTAVGVGGRMLPMFLVAGPGPDWPFRVIGPAGSLGLLLLASGLLWSVTPLIWLGALVGLLAAALFVGLVATWFRRRMVRVLEPAFGHVAVGFGSLLVGLIVGMVQLVQPGLSLRGWTVYAELVLLGWLILFITGIWYRLLGFLLWLHFYRGSKGKPVATAAELVHRPVAWTALGLMAGGMVGLVCGTATASASIARAGATGYLAGSLLVAGHYAWIYAVAGARPSSIAEQPTRRPP